jgi:Predicted epimerase, PhzC/PhzF homolog
MHFETRSGRLTVTREGDSYLLDFPVWGLKPARNPAVGKAMGRDPSELFASIPYLAVYDSAAERGRPGSRSEGGRRPRPRRRARHRAGGERLDYVARYFAPGAGIPEDPATGSAQCVLMPYWAGRLKRQRLVGRQISKRGGDFRCELAGDRVHIGGQAVCYLKGSIVVDD